MLIFLFTKGWQLTTFQGPDRREFASLLVGKRREFFAGHLVERLPSHARSHANLMTLAGGGSMASPWTGSPQQAETSRLWSIAVVAHDHKAP
jgi:hypothetical protein